MHLSLRQLQWWGLGLLCVLLFWAGSSEFRPSMDAMTYGALAKHMVETGDWKHPHYSDQTFNTFYMHPPLVMWMAAALFKVAGVSDLISKVLPFLASAMTLLGVVAWGLLWRSEWYAFIAGLILLTTTRFVKYGQGLILDPFLTAFMVWSVLFLSVAMDRRRGFQFRTKTWAVLAAGLCACAAFLSKGIPTAAVVAVAFLGLAREVKDGKLSASRGGLLWGGFLVAAAVPFFAWLWLGDGAEYLRHYWAGHVSGRAWNGEWETRWGIFTKLAKTYWPWLPFFIWGLLKYPFTLASVMAVFTFGGFALTGNFLEHYLLPFYPFAALVAAEVATPLFEWTRAYLVKFVFGFTVVYAFVLATLPIHVHGPEYRSRIREALKRASIECDVGVIRRMVFSDGLGDQWFGLASGLWYTPWDVVSSGASQPPSLTSADLLLANVGEPVHSDWRPTSIREGFVRVYQRMGVVGCLP